MTPQTPPTFIFSTSEDTTVPSENSVAFYLALHQAHVPAELHIFQKGHHGVGLALYDPALEQWPTLMLIGFAALDYWRNEGRGAGVRLRRVHSSGNLVRSNCHARFEFDSVHAAPYAEIRAFLN